MVSEQVEPEDGKVVVEINFPNDEKQRVRSELFGSYNALNLLAAAAVGFHFEVPSKDIVSALETYTPSNNRSQLQNTSHNRLILDAYNANPSSMIVALEDFNRTFQTDKVLILGDMLELGNESEQEHIAILKQIKKLKVKQVFLVGPIFKAVNTTRNWRSFDTSQEAAEWFQTNPINGATILLKGSRGIHLEEITPQL